MWLFTPLNSFFLEPGCDSYWSKHLVSMRQRADRLRTTPQNKRRKLLLQCCCWAGQHWLWTTNSRMNPRRSGIPPSSATEKCTPHPYHSWTSVVFSLKSDCREEWGESLWFFTITYQQRKADIHTNTYTHDITVRAMVKVWISLSIFFKQKSVHENKAQTDLIQM